MIRQYQPTYQRTTPPKKDIKETIKKNPRLAVRALNDRSFYRFFRTMWDEVSNETYQDNWHIRLLCNHLQRIAEQVAAQKPKQIKETINDAIFNVPPGSSKTTIVMIMFPAWCWTRWYWMEFICLSYSSTLSLESAEASRELIKSEKFQSIYPDLSIKQTKESKSNFQVLKQLTGKSGYAPSIKQGGSRFSTSVGGSLTGFHGHMVLVDDPINPEQAVSPVQLESANRWLDQTMPTRKIHKGSCPTVMIMQRLHEDDPTGHKVEKKGDRILHISLPGQIVDYEDELKPKSLKSFYSEDGLLDPIRMNWNVLDDLKSELGQYGYAGQIGQAPTPPTGGMFEVDKMMVKDGLPQKHEIIKTVRYWDKAGTEAKKGQSKHKGPAWSVGVKMAKLKDGNWLIMNVQRGRWGSGEREKMIRRTADSDGPEVTIIVEQEPGSGGKESAEGTIKNLAGYTVKADRPSGDKIHRADPYSVQVNWGNVYLLQAAWNKEFLNEHRFFPNSTFKDQVDATSGAFKWLNGLKEAEVW